MSTNSKCPNCDGKKVEYDNQMGRVVCICNSIGNEYNGEVVALLFKYPFNTSQTELKFTDKNVDANRVY